MKDRRNGWDVPRLQRGLLELRLYDAHGLPWTLPFTWESLGVAIAEGRLPLTVRTAILPWDAAAFVLREFPAVRHADEEAPEGWGMFPPASAEPILALRRARKSATGRHLPRGSRGVLGALWRAERGVVHRVWVRDEAPRPPTMLDIYTDEIGGVVSLDQTVPHLTDWQVGSLRPLLASDPSPSPSPSP